MKRFTLMLFCILITAACLTPQPVYAASPTYARAVDNKAYFCKNKDDYTSIFAVPYTYCVQVLRDEGEWYFVRYADNAGIYKSLEGYCRKEHFELESQTPQTTFLYKSVTVNFSAGSNTSDLPVLNEIALEAAYYGSYEKGGVYYSYVLCQGSFGYIVGANNDYPLNTPSTKPDDSNGGKSENGQQTAGWNAGLTAFAVIAVLTAAVVIIILFTTRRPKAE